MDLKSMLNDSSAQRPQRLQTSQSHDGRSLDVQDDPYRTRSGQYAPPLSAIDGRSQSNPGYFGPQSPHQANMNSASPHASTPNAGPPSAYTRSPGGNATSYTPRDGPSSAMQYNPPVSSPSMSLHMPPTPGSSHHSQTPASAHGQPASGMPYSYMQSPRDHQPPLSTVNVQPRQISPQSAPYPQPATPLGPPLSYPRASPHAPRPLSQGVDQHHRKSSLGSVGSGHSRSGHNVQTTAELQRQDSNQRRTMSDTVERERSLSVSPKTIPQPSPYSQMSPDGLPGSQRPSVQPNLESTQLPNATPVESLADATRLVSATQSRPTSVEQPALSRATSSIMQSPAPPTKQELPPTHVKPQQYSLSRNSPTVAPLPTPVTQLGLKRTASVMSERSVTQLARKRLRRDPTPVFAQTLRKKTPKFGTRRHDSSAVMTAMPSVQAARTTPQPTVNGLTPAPPSSGPGPTPNAAAGPRWESSITDQKPIDEVVKSICDWIFFVIGNRENPGGGAVFEIEAKLGTIFDVEKGGRLDLPVNNETVFNPDRWHRTKFEPDIQMMRHQQLNRWLNHLAEERRKEIEAGAQRHPILYSHPQVIDEFYELTADGHKNLGPSIVQYLNARHKPRVRRTIDGKTGQLEAQIVKSRIADLNVYNPSTDCDYRISISIESPWEGDLQWLIPTEEKSQGRQKDRISYRHMAYQVDLTQVLTEKGEVKHELEVELATQALRHELDGAKAGQPNRYVELVEGLVNNVRLLCRRGSIQRA